MFNRGFGAKNFNRSADEGQERLARGLCFSLWWSLVFLLGSPIILSAELLHFDDFEYVVNRENSPLPGATNNPFVIEGGWTYTKAVNLTGSSVGYLYTKTSIPGYSGIFPGRNSSHVLMMESRNVSGGSDYYLAYGHENVADNEQVPGNVWFQWWMYINHYGSELSGIENRHKFIYPCAGNYPCNEDKWLISLSHTSYSTLNVAPWGNPTAGGEAFLINRDMTVGNVRYEPACPDNCNKLGPNLQDLSQSYLVPNRWNLIKLHLDTSNSSSGRMEVWMKVLGGEWVKTTEWIGGVTPNFTWNGFEAGGHRVFRMPTTIGWTDTTGGAYYYIDDFAMADSESSLPDYGNPTPPRGLGVR